MDRLEKLLTPEGRILVEGMRREGISVKEIAKRTGVAMKVLESCAELKKELSCDRESTDYAAELALLRRALGYEYCEETWELKLNKETGENELILTKKQVKHMQPDVSALTLWLKKRRPEIWGDSSAPEGTHAETGIVLMPQVGVMEDDIIHDHTGGDTPSQET